MSGIMAIVSLDGRPVPPELARAQLAAIAHRGEWEPRLWEAPGVALGHVNLPRTPEAEREVLPMADRAGRYWLTWDGRLDNRDELGAKLGYDGTERAGKSDAEYVLDAFLKWGDDCVHHLVGDWAVVIWDNEARRLFCAKDPLGWRQLFYAERDGLLLVGSEPQQLFAGGWLPKTVNEEYVARFLGGALQEPGSTHYEGISELRGGELAWAGADGVKVRAHWTAPRKPASKYRRFEEYVEAFEALFEQALAARLRSNRPIGVLMSGGLDSSYVTNRAAAQDPSVEAFTLYVPGSRWLDERQYARLVAERSHVPLHEVDVTECWFLSSEWLPDSTLDQPAVPGAGPSLRKITRYMAAQGVGVVLGGEGGDEWVEGGNWSISPYRTLSSTLLSGHLGVARRISRVQHPRRGTASNFARALFHGATPQAAQAAVRRAQGKTSSPPFWPFVRPGTGWTHLYANAASAATDQARSLEAMLEVYRNVASPEVSWRDRHIFASQHLDSRSPFNDRRVIEHLSWTPDWARQFDGHPRSVLRAALRAAGLKEIALRADKGVYEEQLWAGLLEQEPQRLQRAVEAVATVDSVDREVLGREVKEWASTRHRWGRPIYQVATCGLWLRQAAGLQQGRPAPLLAV